MIKNNKNDRVHRSIPILRFLMVSISCLIIAFPIPATAQEFGWEGAWKFILDNNPGLGAIKQSVFAARASMKLSAVPMKVTAILSGTTTKEESDRSSSSAGVSLSWNSSLFGRESALVEVETAAFREAEALLDITTLNLYRQTAIAFWGTAAGSASIKAGEDEISKRRAFLADAKLRYEQGMVPELDVMRAESALVESIHSLALIEVTRSGFAAMFKGLAGWKDISPAKGLFDLDEEIMIRTAPPDFPSVAQNHPSVRRANWALEKAISLLRVAEMIPLPTLNVTATKTLLADGAASTVYTQDDWWMRATLSIPVIDGGQARWTVEKARAGLVSAEAALGAAKAEVMMNLFSAWNDYTAAAKGLEAEKIRFKLVEREREIILLRYREGLANQIEVLDAQTRFAASLAALIDSKRAFLVAEVSLASAEGRIPEGEAD